MSGICLLIAPVPVHCFSITFRAQGALDAIAFLVYPSQTATTGD